MLELQPSVAPFSSPQIDQIRHVEASRFLSSTLASNETKRNKKKRLILVRHGQTDYNNQMLVQGQKINAELNSVGHEQAQRLAERLKREHIDFVACSSLLRAMQTCDAILAHHPNKKLQETREIYDELQEMSYGILEGKVYDPKHPESVAETLRHFAYEWEQAKAYHTPIPEGESPLDVERRAVPVIRKLVEEKVEHQGLIVATADSFA
eukprot:TRINITY_DN969_c0_g1_i2.p1 TRINITY_DN969_c0_g1~~TRINITY_DN969_c0_g1_i2.p1  ORF type:complete len:209 (+),score=45.47 TRINITY_DN969_c0_g1_i2:235-861(+)